MRRAWWFSLSAGVLEIALLVFVLAGASRPVVIGVGAFVAPAAVASFMAAIRFRRGAPSAAAAVASVLLWIFVVVWNVRGGIVMLPAAVLQSLAWYQARPPTDAAVAGSAESSSVPSETT